MNSYNKKAIAFVTNNWYPYQAGVARALEVTQKELIKLGYCVYIITFDFTGQNTFHDDEYVLRIPSWFHWLWRSNHLVFPLFTTYWMRRCFKRIKPVVIHAHHPFLLGLVAQRIAREQRIPFVFTYHSQYASYVDHYAPFGAGFFKYLIETRVYNFCRRARYVIAPSESVRKTLVQKKIKNVVVIPSGVCTTFLSVQKPKKEWKNRFNLLTVGRFVSEKDIPFLLDVVRLLDDRFVFTIAGFGREEESLKRYAYHTCGLQKKQVIFVVRPSRQDLIDLYHKSHLFIFASQTETQGLVCAESMGAGTPVVARIGPGVRDIVCSGINGFLVDTPHIMAVYIKKALENRDLYDLLSDGAWHTAQHYNPVYGARRLSALYACVEPLLGQKTLFINRLV